MDGSDMNKLVQALWFLIYHLGKTSMSKTILLWFKGFHKFYYCYISLTTTAKASKQNEYLLWYSIRSWKVWTCHIKKNWNTYSYQLCEYFLKIYITLYTCVQCFKPWTKTYGSPPVFETEQNLPPIFKPITLQLSMKYGNSW